jgi:hypothetical protein
MRQTVMQASIGMQIALQGLTLDGLWGNPKLVFEITNRCSALDTGLQG